MLLIGDIKRDKSYDNIDKLLTHIIENKCYQSGSRSLKPKRSKGLMFNYVDILLLCLSSVKKLSEYW